MASTTLVSEHQQALADLTTLAAAALVEVWAATRVDDAPAATLVMVETVPLITTAYGDVAAGLAADYYDESRAAARVAGRYRAIPAPVAPLEQVEKLVRWAVGPLWSETPNPNLALTKIAATTERLVRQPARQTVLDNTERDPQAKRPQRITAPGGCSFCLMVASNLSTSGRGHYHDNCRCGEAPMFGNDDYPDPSDLYRDFIDSVT